MELLAIQVFNNHFQEALDYGKFHLVDKSSHYHDKVAQYVAKWARRLEGQMKFKIFDSFDPISIPSFLFTFKLKCDTNGVHEEAALSPLNHCTKCAAAVPLNACIAKKLKWHKLQKESAVASWCEAVNYLLETPATDDITAGTEADMMQLNQP